MMDQSHTEAKPDRQASQGEPVPALPDTNRDANLAFGNVLLDREIDRRNDRKRDQEGTARGIVVTSGALLTILLAVAGEAGLFETGASWVARGFFILSITAAVAAAACGLMTQAPRKFARLGKDALRLFNDVEFLDSSQDHVNGRTLGAKIDIAVKADTRHEEKASWLIAAFVSLTVALVGVLGQGIDLAIEGIQSRSSDSRPTLGTSAPSHVVTTTTTVSP